MTAIIHRTPGLLDLRAITVMGLSAKPGTDNPIGMFGTGLKYAIATLCRNGCAPVVWIGRDRYEFSAKAGEFRGAAYKQLRMRRDAPGLLRPSYKQLPFTTEYGKFWAVWMAFRELESNTRDEGGETWCEENPLVLQQPGGNAETCIVVDLPEYIAAWTFRDETFLPNGARAPEKGGPTVQVFNEGPRDRLYWRGLRVKDLIAKKTVRTYNFLEPLQLTEDRTLASEWSARYALACHVARSDDAALIRDVICADEKHWEHRLDWPSHIEPSDTFKTVSIQERGRSYGSWGYASGHIRRAPAPVSAWAKAARPWKLEDDADDPRRILNANGEPILERPDNWDADAWVELAETLCGIVNARERRDAEAGADDDDTPATVQGYVDGDEIPF